MARPTVQHSGFLIPNAQDVSNPILAEPDKIDFNTVADSRWGVVTGCALGEQGPLALTVGTGVAVVNSALVPVRGGTVTLAQPTAGARFINIVVDNGGVIRTIDGTATADPVYPDVPDENTLLATVYASSDAVSLQDFVVDKRKFLTPALFSNVGATADLVVNYNSPSPPEGQPSIWFRINGQGAINWAGDTVLQRLSAGHLRLNDKLTVTQALDVGDAITAMSLTATALVKARNLRNQSTVPELSASSLGDLWANTVTGVVSVVGKDPVTEALEWQPLATGDTALPVGTVIDSVETKTIMISKGWLPLDGRVISEDDYENLFTLSAMVPWISGGTYPHRQMTLPNLERRFRLTDSNDTARLGGSNSKFIARGQLPKHVHDVKVAPHGTINPTAQLSGSSGSHGHTIVGDGMHDHNVYDQGHLHGADFINLHSQGGAMTDGIINDRSHTYRVQHNPTTAYGYARIVAQPAAIGGLSIAAGGYHNHTVQVSAITGLTHVVDEEPVGDGAAFDITPAYFTVRTYIRT